MEDSAAIVLNSSTLAAISTLIGALSGAILFLFRQLVSAKDAEIKAMEKVNERLIAERNASMEARDRVIMQQTTELQELRNMLYRSTPPQTHIMLPPSQQPPTWER